MAALLIVDGLPDRVNDQDLNVLFQPFGIVLSARVVRDGVGGSLNFGFVEMESHEQAEAAKGQLNGELWEDHRLVVMFVTDETPSL